MSFGSSHIVLKNNIKLLASSRSRKRRLIDSYVGISTDVNNCSKTQISEVKPWVNKRIAETLKRRNRDSNLRLIFVFIAMMITTAVAIYLIFI